MKYSFFLLCLSETSLVWKIFFSAKYLSMTSLLFLICHGNWIYFQLSKYLPVRLNKRSLSEANINVFYTVLLPELSRTDCLKEVFPCPQSNKCACTMQCRNISLFPKKRIYLYDTAVQDGRSCPKCVISMLAVCIWSLLPWMQLLLLLPVLGLVQVCSCRCCNTWCRFAQRSAFPFSQGYLPEW